MILNMRDAISHVLQLSDTPQNIKDALSPSFFAPMCKQLTPLQIEALKIACEAMGQFDELGPVGLGALCVIQEMIGNE
jgi:predicted DNA binding protein